MIKPVKPKITTAQRLNGQHFDVIVIGSGIGGLTAAGLLAKSGKKLLVIEQHDRPGGYAHGFKRKNYHFDAGVHITSGCGPSGYVGGQVIHHTLKVLGVLDELEFIEVNPFCHVIYPEFKASMPLSVDALIAEFSLLFPMQRQALQSFIELCQKINQQAVFADEIVLSDDPEQIRKQLGALQTYRQATLAEVLDEYIDDQQLQSLLASTWPYLGLPPSCLSFIYWATMFISYLVDGSFYCKGGFQKLADALVLGITNNGGEVIYKHAVNKVHIENSCVYGVSVEQGLSYFAPIVISNADMRKTVHDWVGEEYFPKRFLTRMANMKHSTSIFVTYIATDLDLSGFSPETFCYSGLDHDKNYLDVQKGQLTWLSITIPTLNDQGLAPQGQHLVVLTSLVPFELHEDWSMAKIPIQDKLVDLAENYIPGLKQHILFKESGSPSTLYRYTLNHQGAAYGWDANPEQMGPYRAKQSSPVQGLYFAGHWTAPGGGVYGVSVSGLKVAQLILGKPWQAQFWSDLGL